MISTYVKQISSTAAVVVAVIGLFPAVGSAQSGSLSLSVTPTLFEMSASPGQEWQSAVRVVNSNRYPITVYPDVVNFAPRGERGTGRLLPLGPGDTDGATLAEWIELERAPVTIAPESTERISFTVTVPEDATPGGHFAAITVGTRPPDDDGGFQLRTSQVVTSLFFVRIAGDVVEKGTVRSFRTETSFSTRPTASFELRFENKGNVHLQPQGDITIYNWWGEERGVIPINQRSNFGNVLPESIRRYAFTWEGEQSLTDIGRFKAVATLAYGQDARHFVTQTTYFWVVPIYEVALTLGALLLVGFILSRIVRAYIRHMLRLSGIDPDAPRPHRVRTPGDVEIGSYKVAAKDVASPVTHGYRDLRTRLATVSGLWARACTTARFVWSYRLFFAGLMFVCLCGYAIYWYVDEATQAERPYNVIIENEDRTVELSSEEIMYQEQYSEQPVVTNTADLASSTIASLTIINQSGVSGVGAIVQRRLEEAGFEVLDSQVSLNEARDRSVVVFSVDRQGDAVRVSQQLNNALLSATASASTSELTVYIGADLAAAVMGD